MDDVEATAELLVADGFDEGRDVDVDRAAIDTERLLAVEAAVGLGESHLLREALVDRTEVLCALDGILLAGRRARRLHIRNIAAIYLWHAQIASS